MNNRRAKLLALAVVASAAVLVTATGAFTSVSADRTATVNVSDDSDALLAMYANGTSENGVYAVNNSGSNGDQIRIHLDDGGQSIDGGGTGLNDDAVSHFDHVFVIQNQGTQEVEVSVNDIGKGSGTVTYYNTANSDANTFPPSIDSLETEDSGSAETLGVGDSLTVGIQVDPRSASDNVAEGNTPTNMDVTVAATATN